MNRWIKAFAMAVLAFWLFIAVEFVNDLFDGLKNRENDNDDPPDEQEDPDVPDPPSDEIDQEIEALIKVD